MKVLVLGHYKDGTGWSNACINQILALDSAGVDVVPRAIKLNTSTISVPERILELESKSTEGSEICIQHLLPHHMEYNGRFKKNIAYCYYEMFDNKSSNWNVKLSCMDEVWTCSEYSRQCLSSMGVTSPILNVPLSFDMSKYEKTYQRIDHPEFAGNVLYYTICDLNKRKDLYSTILGFNLAFTPNMPVRLVIKSSKHGMSEQECGKIIVDECNKIKHGMKLYRRAEDYMPEVIIPDFISDDEVMQIHNTCDIYVTTSHGEGWCIPMFEAQAMGNLSIYPKAEEMPMMDFADGYGFDTNESTVWNMNDTFFEISSSREFWRQTNIRSYVSALQQSYHDFSERGLRGANSLSMYSNEVVGKKMKELFSA